MNTKRTSPHHQKPVFPPVEPVKPLLASSGRRDTCDPYSEPLRDEESFGIHVGTQKWCSGTLGVKLKKMKNYNFVCIFRQENTFRRLYASLLIVPDVRRGLN